MSKKKKILMMTMGVVSLTTPIAVIACGGGSKPTVGTGNKTGNESPANPEAVETKETISAHNNNIRVGSWNIANFNDKDIYAKSHIQTLSDIITDAKLDVLAIQEIDSLSAIDKLVDKLNFSNKTSRVWKSVKSDYSYKAKKATGTPEAMGGISAREYYAFIYDSKKLSTKSFDDGKVGALYENPWKPNHFLTGAAFDKSAYVRPPFGVTFATKDKDFTLVTSHFDSPGGKAKAGKDSVKNNSLNGTIKSFERKSSSNDEMLHNFGSGVGSQEVWEAQQIVDVMNWFETKAKGDKDLIFMGDTNIKYFKGKDNPFQPVIDAGYIELFNPSLDESKTTLGSGKTSSSIYASPYDRFYNKTGLYKEGSAKKYRLDKIANINKKTGRSVTTLKGITGKIKLSDIKKRTSDHTIIYQDLDLTQKENGKSTNPVKKFSQSIKINTAPAFDLITKAGLNMKLVNKILYYRNLVGKIDANILDNLINYRYGGKINEIDLDKFLNKRSLIIDYSVDGFDKKNEEEFLDNSGYITTKRTIKLNKIDINTAPLTVINKLVNDGLIDQETEKEITSKRSEGIKINDLSDIKSDKLPSKILLENLFVFTSESKIAVDPFDLNAAPAEDLFKAYTEKIGGSSILRKEEVYAIIARRNVKPINDIDELATIIGEYNAKNKYKSTRYVFGETVHNDLNDKNALVAKFAKNKLMINNVTEDEFNEIFDFSGKYEYQDVQDIIKKQVDDSNGNPGDTVTVNGAKDLNDYISKKTREPKHIDSYKPMMNTLFKFGTPVNVVIKEKVDTNSNKSLSLLKLQAQDLSEVAWIKWVASIMPKFDGKLGSSKIGAMSNTQAGYIYKAFKNKANSITNYTTLSNAAQEIKRYSETTLKKMEVLKEILPLSEQN